MAMKNAIIQMPVIGDQAPDFDAVTTIGNLKFFKFSEYKQGDKEIPFIIQI
jgi:alkyl hydroperoxide reductase subunit AhpC